MWHLELQAVYQFECLGIICAYHLTLMSARHCGSLPAIITPVITLFNIHTVFLCHSEKSSLSYTEIVFMCHIGYHCYTLR